MQKQILASAILAAMIALSISGCAEKKKEDPAETAVVTPEARDKKDGPEASATDDQQEVVAVTGSRLNRQALDQQEKEEPKSLPFSELPPVSSPPPAKAVRSVAPNGSPMLPPPAPMETTNTEKYADHDDNAVMQVAESPVSTFSIDVDTGSYSNVRRMLNQGQLPPADAVRAEEFINYFDYAYKLPASLATPFSVTTELAPAPWNKQRQLLLVGIKGYEVKAAEMPPSNLVFLIDTSGSMQSEDKIGLLKASFTAMVSHLRAQDRISIVVYAGSAGLVLPPTPGDQHETILAALNGLEAGGSTNGAAGIELAYEMARKAFISRGVNRVVLATDGDFNVGTVDIEALKTMVADKRKSGIALTTLGFGQDNYNDELAEQLADIGNGNHAYIDSLAEGKRVLVDQRSATLLTIAKDVKIQMEFNPQVVAEYRLIGYENRALRREDFNNDQVDAGEIGAGHNVTALYELTLVGSNALQSDPLRYGKPVAQTEVGKNQELAFLRLRYKRPQEDKSQLIETPIHEAALTNKASSRLQWAASIAAFADVLRGGTHLGGYDLKQVIHLAEQVSGQHSERIEAIELMQKAQALQTPQGGTSAQISE
jgi:Ca-activated chloride channel family protein